MKVYIAKDEYFPYYKVGRSDETGTSCIEANVSPLRVFIIKIAERLTNKSQEILREEYNNAKRLREAKSYEYRNNMMEF